MKKVICLLLLLSLLLCGCASGSTSNGELPFGGPKINVQNLPEKVENPDKLPVLKWVCLTDFGAGGGNRVWSENAAHQLNQMLEQRNMPFRVQFVMLTAINTTVDFEWLAQKEAQKALKGADLIFGNLSSQDMVKYLMPITEYAAGEAEPSLENAVPVGEDWLRGTVGEEIYGIPGYLTVVGESTCWYVDPKVFTEYGFAAEDFQGKKYWEMDDLFAQIYERNGNKAFLNKTIGGSFIEERIEQGQADVYSTLEIGACSNAALQEIGAVFAVDSSKDTPEVINVLEIEATRWHQEAMIRYADAGYSTGADESVLIRYSNAACDFITEGELGIVIPADTAYYHPAQGYGIVSGVAASTDHKQEALQLLSLIGEDEEFRLHMAYGKEGQDYRIGADGSYSIIRHEDGSSYSLDFLSSLNYYSGKVSGSADNSGLYSPTTRHYTYYTEEGKTLLETHRNMIARATHAYPLNISPADKTVNTSALIFDFTGFEAELDQIYQICDYYLRFLTNDKEVKDDKRTEDIDESLPRMTKELYDQMLAELKAAGSDRIQAELQRQLEEWRTNNSGN